MFYGEDSYADMPEKKKKAPQKYKKQEPRKPRKPVYTPAEDGTPPSEETLKALRSRGLNYCYWMIGESDKTEKYLREKLVKRGYPEEIIESIIDSLKEDDYINDEKYARMFAKDRQEFGNKGSRAIKYDLMRKGVDAETVAEVIEEIHDPEAEEDRARAYIERRVASTRGLDTQKRITRLASALARRGYDPSMSFRIVRDAVNADIEEMSQEEGFDEDNFDS